MHQTKAWCRYADDKIVHRQINGSRRKNSKKFLLFFRLEPDKTVLVNDTAATAPDDDDADDDDNDYDNDAVCRGHATFRYKIYQHTQFRDSK